MLDEEPEGTLESSTVESCLQLANKHLSDGNHVAALDAATQALHACDGHDNLAGEAAALFIMGTAQLAEDSCSSAGIQHVQSAVAGFKRLGDMAAVASVLHALADISFSHGQLEDGLTCAWEALAGYRQLGDVASADALKETIEEARAVTAELRKTIPKQPRLLEAGSLASTCQSSPRVPITQSAASTGLCQRAYSARRYWDEPRMIQQNFDVDAAARLPSHSIIWGHCLSDHAPTETCVEFGNLVANMAKGDATRIPIVVQTRGVHSRMCGQLVPSSLTNMSAVTLWGLVRTVRQEVPQIQITLLDFSEELTAAEIPRQLRPPTPAVNESAYYHHIRYEPQIAEVPSLLRRGLKRDGLAGRHRGKGSQNAAAEARRTTEWTRRPFNWAGPSHKLDRCWFRQEWRAAGPAEDGGRAGPPPPPCRELRNGR